MLQNHAVVIGGSIAGMCAAQALRTKFDTVTILEQDEFPDPPDGRRGTPQACHAHFLLDRGRSSLEALFPGFTSHCADGGGIIIDPAYEAAQCFPGGGWSPRKASAERVLFASRPKIESSIRDMVRRDPNVTFIESARASGLITSTDGQVRVTGVQYEIGRGGDLHQLAADFVVDAAGRGSRCAKWMQDLGISVEERTLDAGVTYSSRWFRFPAEDFAWWKWLVVFPANAADAPAEHQYVCTIFPIEDNCAIAVMGSWGGQTMPATGDEFEAAYHRTRGAEFIRALDLSEPISDVYRTKSTRNVWRRFDRVENPPAGYVAVGDAVCAFNPIYGQGITCAAANGVILRELLDTHDPAGTPFARAFYARQGELLERPWQLAMTRDGVYPQATGTDVMSDGIKKKLISKLTWSGFQFLNEAAYQDDVIKEHYDRVNNLRESLAEFLRNPRVLFGVARYGVRKALGGSTLHPEIQVEATPVRD